ncbi:MAG TPA: CsgG/HfaB family protein, partial [Bacillota bacterium]|nr:CsgG/HfaB family protein [Bacillota bacterium]
LGVHYLIMGRVTEFADNSKGATVFLPRNGFGLGIKAHTAQVAIDARVVDATTAEIQYAVTGRGEKKQTSLGIAVNWNTIGFGSDEFKKTNLGIALRDAVASVASQLCEKVYGTPAPSIEPGPVSGLVADIFEKKVYLTVGTADGVEPGMNLIIHHVIRTVKNPQTDEIIDYITEPVAEIEVTEVKEKSAVGVITKRLNRRYEITINDLVTEKEPRNNNK